MNSQADVVVVGGGVNGCAIAYNLAKEGVSVVVLEKNYLGSGATGRCSGGIRRTYDTKVWLRLAMESFELWQKLEDELDYDVEYIHNGYLFLCKLEENVKLFKQMTKVQRGLGIDVEYLEQDEVTDILPLDVERIGVEGATWCPSDGCANPFKVVEAYANAARKLGAEVRPYTKVEGMKIEEGKPTSIFTNRGEIKAKTVVNAAGHWSPEINTMVGLSSPNAPYRFEELVTDPVAPVNNGAPLPFIIFLDFLPWSFSAHQAGHGELILTSNDARDPPSMSMHSSLDFTLRVARAVSRYLPGLENLHVVRQWCGLLDNTPDQLPILGYSDTVEGLIQANGFDGHGFVTGPAVGKLVTELVLRGKASMPEAMEKMAPKRFAGKHQVAKALKYL